MKFRKSARKDHKLLKKQKKRVQSVKYLQWQKSARTELSGKIQKNHKDMRGINGQMNRIFSKLDIYKKPESSGSSVESRNLRDEDVEISEKYLGDRLERAYNCEEEEVKSELVESFQDRIARLNRENEEEDKEISKLEKMLYLNKRKNNNMPKSFVDEGLDFIIEVVDKKYKKKYNDDMDLLDEADGELKNAFINKNSNSDEESSETDGDKYTKENKKRRLVKFIDQSAEESNQFDKKRSEIDSSMEDDIDEDFEDSDVDEDRESDEEYEMDVDASDESEVDDGDSRDEHNDESDVLVRLKSIKRTKTPAHGSKLEMSKGKVGDEEDSTEESNELDGNADGNSESDESYENDSGTDEDTGAEGDEEEKADDFIRKKSNIGADGSYEDIYGRKRSASGDVINATVQKYIPPAARLAISNDVQLEKLKKQIKGLLNRLSETNLRPIGQQMSELYAKHSKNSVTSTLIVVITDAVFGLSATPERLILEPALLCSLLHANIGVEVGAQILEEVIDRFKSLSENGAQGKQMENLLQFLCYLFLFKVVSYGVIYDILKKFDPADEKNVDYIMAILKTCGFGLRKCDPLALKELIVALQAKCKYSSSSRHQFMLDTLMALKNNNISKASNCDPSVSDRAFKSMKACLNKGAVIQQLNVSLEDLYDARVRGKWWLVGSAWANEDPSRSSKKNSIEEKVGESEEFSSKILELAAKVGMNTDVRRALFCVIMSAQDYLDASERILRMNLTHIQQRDLCYILVLCTAKEKRFNPYYAHLALFFCQQNRKVFSMTLQCAIWDFIKSIDSHSETKVKFLALFTSLLVCKKGLPLAVLKNIEFVDLSNDKVIAFLRYFLLDVLKSLDDEEIMSIFSKISLAGPNLVLVKEGLLVFFKKFLLTNSKFLHDANLTEMKKKLKVAEKALHVQKEKEEIDIFG